mgnify:CR=1 FL=1
MRRFLLRAKASLRDATKPLASAAVGALTVGLLRTTRYFDPIKTANLFGRIAQLIGPLFREQRIGRANLTAAFPEKSPEEIEKILAGVWDNLGRLAAEFAHIDQVWDHDEAHPERGRIEIPKRTHELFHQLRLDGKPALIFASHLGNWELPALAAVAHGLDTAVLFRRPNIASADRAIEELRSVNMGTLIPSGRDAPIKLAQALQNGQHAAMLVDQYLGNGRQHLPRLRAPPDPWRAHHSPAQPSLPRRTVGRNPAGAQRQRRDRRAGHDAGDHLGDRGLDSRIPRSMAVAAPPLAVGLWCCNVIPGLRQVAHPGMTRAMTKTTVPS